jgi:cytoskeletal protein CcmA (bactofilin family)
MAIFNKPPADRPATRLDSGSAEPSVSVIGSGMRIVGDIESNGVIKVEGVIEGSVRGARQLLLGKSGTIHGDVHAVDAVLGGAVVGNIVASERVEIQGTSSVEGDILTKNMVVYEGGTINGTVRMGEQAVLAKHTPAAGAPSMGLVADG